VVFTATVEQDQGWHLFEELRKAPEPPAAPPSPMATPVMTEAILRAPPPEEAAGPVAPPPVLSPEPEALHAYLMHSKKNAIQDVRKMADLFVALRERAGEPPPEPPRAR
jgi:hypothetical protein